MTPRWDSGEPLPEARQYGAAGALRALWRGPLLIGLVFGTLVLLLLVRLIERPLHGKARPWTPYMVQFVCRNSLRILRLRLTRCGQPSRANGAIVANHSSWLDIFVLNAARRVYFVAKAEVAGWVGIGWLARATGTVFIERDRKHARAQRDMLQDRLEHGHHLLFFPEGTSSDGRRVLPFKSTLFDALLKAAPEDLEVQPVSVHYFAPPGEDPRFYGWWGEMSFGTHLHRLLKSPGPGEVVVTFHEPLKVAEYSDRKALAAVCHKAVTGGFESALTGQAS